jgi:hypothetical protein
MHKDLPPITGPSKLLASLPPHFSAQQKNESSSLLSAGQRIIQFRASEAALISRHAMLVQALFLQNISFFSFQIAQRAAEEIILTDKNFLLIIVRAIKS